MVVMFKRDVLFGIDPLWVYDPFVDVWHTYMIWDAYDVIFLWYVIIFGCGTYYGGWPFEGVCFVGYLGL